MIIFDLDGTLADCSHRRPYVDFNSWVGCQEIGTDLSVFFPNWQAFYQACDRDMPIEPMINLFRNYMRGNDWQIWSGRCESVREKTLKWLCENVNYDFELKWAKERLKMRPIGDSTPDDQLKEKWLDEALAEGKTVDMVFDDRPKVLRMWQRRGIFTFDVGQGKGEF